MVLAARARDSETVAVIHEDLIASAEYRSLTAPRSRLSVQHCYGAANPIPDAISRAYWDTFAALTDALGVKCTEIAWDQPPVCAFMRRLE
eukprot:5823664-Pleurochrysis_carterae.AAC.1